MFSFNALIALNLSFVLFQLRLARKLIVIVATSFGIAFGIALLGDGVLDFVFLDLDLGDGVFVFLDLDLDLGFGSEES